MNQNEREYRNANLLDCANIAKDNGLKVYTFESSDKYISQIFITDGVNIGTVSCDFSELSFGTVHKPCREAGTGYQMSVAYVPTLADIKKTFAISPGWGKHEYVKKWKNWNEYTSNQINAILKYYEL